METWFVEVWVLDLLPKLYVRFLVHSNDFAYFLQVEQLEIEVAELKKTLAEKKEQEVAMLQVCLADMTS